MNIVFNNREETLARIAQLYRAGHPPTVICPVCRAEIVIRYVAETAASASAQGGIASLYCPNDKGHAFIIGEADRDEFMSALDAVRKARQTRREGEPSPKVS